MTDLSIVIVTYKGWSRLEKCLAALSLFGSEKFSSEVIIVDNTPDEGEIVPIKTRFPQFTFIHNEVNGGFANGCNLGASHAKGKFLLFLNPDTVAGEDAIGHMINLALNNPGYGIISCRQFNENGKESRVSGIFPRPGTLTGFMRIFSKNQGEPEGNLAFPDWVSGSVILIAGDQFKALGGFDEDFWMYYEDVDICKRVRNSGREVVVCRNISIEHNHGGSSRSDARTSSVTRSEVLISRHVYISKHFHSLSRPVSQVFLVLNNLLTFLVTGMAGLVFFFIPKLFMRTHLFFRLISYYFGAAGARSWISSRSVRRRA